MKKMQQDPSGPGPGGGHVPVPDRPRFRRLLSPRLLRIHRRLVHG